MNVEERRYQTLRNLEKQLVTLTRQYFILEKDTSLSQYTKGSTLVKGNRVIRLYKSEYENTLTDLERAVSSGKSREDDKIFGEILRLLDEKKLFDEDVQDYRTALNQIEKEKKIIRKKVEELEKYQVTDRQQEERLRNAIKTIKVLENKLERQTKHFDRICAKNKELRAEIDHILKERCIFINQWNFLVDRLAEGKKFMLDLIEQGTIAYNQAAEMWKKLQFARTKVANDWQKITYEMRGYQRTLDRKSKLSDFLLIKNQKRVNRYIEQEKIEKQKVFIEETKQKLEEYNKIITSIKSFSKTDNVGVMATMFAQQEKCNLSNFTYILDLVQDSETRSDQLIELQSQISDQKALYASREMQQKETLENLRLQFENIKSEVAKSRQLTKDSESYLDELLKGVSKLFFLCRCDTDPLFRMLGNYKKIDVLNVHKFIDVLKKKVEQLLIAAVFQDIYRKNDKKKFAQNKKQERIYTINEIVTTTPCVLCVEHEVVTDLIHSVQKVWSKDEAKENLELKLSLPEGSARLHNLDQCQLPRSRRVIQKKYE